MLAQSRSDKRHKRQVRDLSTDLRDSEVYANLLSVLAPQHAVPMERIEKTVRAELKTSCILTQDVGHQVDLHARAKLTLTAAFKLGCRDVSLGRALVLVLSDRQS